MTTVKTRIEASFNYFDDLYKTCITIIMTRIACNIVF